MKNAKAMFRLLIVFVLAVMVLNSVSVAQTDQTTTERIDDEFTGAVGRQAFSGVVLVAYQGEILLNKGYGFANLEWDIPNTPDTKFRIASVTKQFTSMAILRLQEQGKLNIDDPICDYLDECADSWQDITIYHLLTHTSGIPDYVSDSGFRDQMRLSMSHDDVVDLFFEQPLVFTPGELWQYSNSGYHLLGLIIENVSDQSYARYLRDTFFEPFGMENTGLDSSTAIIGQRAEGYGMLLGNRRAEYIDMSLPFSAGGLYSTVGDLHRWQQALFNGEVVSQASWDSMLERAVDMPDPDVQYAYGLVIGNLEGHTSIGHGGGLPGFLSSVDYLPDDDLSIIILCNAEGVNMQVYRSVIAGIILGE